MTTLDPRTEAYAELLASQKSDDDRAAVEQQKNQLVMAQLPQEEVGKPPVRSLGDYLDDEIEAPPMLVEPGLVGRGAVSALISRGGKGKTTISLNRLLRWSMGKPLFDELPDVFTPAINPETKKPEPLRVLIIENEGAPGHFQKVLKIILHKSGFSQEEIELARENVHVWKDGGWSGLKLDDHENLDLVKRGVSECEADIAFIEPFRGLWRGDENSSTEMANVLDALEGMATTLGCGVMICHHENKSGGGEGADPMSAARGSGALEGTAAVMERWAPVQAGRQRELSQIKNRFDQPYAPVRMEFDAERWGYIYKTEDEGERALLKFMTQFPNQYLTLQEMMSELDEKYPKVRKWANSLAEDGKLRKRALDGKQKYAYHPTSSDEDDSGVAVI